MHCPNSYHLIRTHAPLSLLIITATLFSLSIFTVSAQETRIVTTSGEVFNGEILREESDTIFFRLYSGIEFVVPKTSLRSIEYNTADDVESSHGYWSVGGAFGTPSGINLVLARNFNPDLSLRLSGFVLGGLVLDISHGVEVDMAYRIGKSGSVDHSLFLGAGTFGFQTLELYNGHAVLPVTRSRNYVAGGYTLHWNNLQATAGLSYGVGELFNPFPVVQIGYVHRFR